MTLKHKNHTIITSALQASLDYKSQPITGKSPEESSYRQNHGWVMVSVIAKSKTKEQDHSLV